jgi:hypothetical protein
MLRRSLAWTILGAIVVVGAWDVLDLPKYAHVGCDYEQQQHARYKCTSLHIVFVPFWYLAKISYDLEKEILGLSTFFIAFFTLVLAFLAIGQHRQTKILQRAYVRVSPHGIENLTTGELIGKVALQNVGKLPATDLFFAAKICRGNEKWEPPKLSDAQLMKVGTLPIETGWIMASDGIAAQNTANLAYVYAYGRATYLDGFKKKRFVEFCHRYPWEKKQTPAGGGLRINFGDARPHGEYNRGD